VPWSSVRRGLLFQIDHARVEVRKEDKRGREARMSDHPYWKESAIPIAIMLVLLASALIAQLSAAPTSRTFLLRVCNKAEAHSRAINLATASLTPDLSHMRVIGWVLLPTSRCVDVGQFQKPGVYLYAMSGESTELAGQGPVLCVNTNEKFDYTFVLDHDPPCPAHHVPKQFVLLELPDLQIDGFTFTIE
jgi:hypothetical protein